MNLRNQRNGNGAQKEGMFDNIKWVPVIIALLVGLLVPDAYNPLKSVAEKLGSSTKKEDKPTT